MLNGTGPVAMWWWVPGSWWPCEGGQRAGGVGLLGCSVEWNLLLSAADDNGRRSRTSPLIE